MKGSDKPNTDATKSQVQRRHKLRNRAQHYERSLATIRPKFTPDPLKDSNAERSKELKKMMTGLIPRLSYAADDDLQEVIVDLGAAPALDLYCHKAHDRVAGMINAMVGKAPAWCKVEHAQGRLHAHIITSSDAQLLLPAGALRRPVYNLAGLLYYLSKPGDSRAAMVTRTINGQTRTSDNSDENMLAAIKDLELARSRAGGKRFPRLSWSLNLPRLTSDQKAALMAN